MAKYVIGIDFGTDSARALLVNAANGVEISSSVKYYPRWMEGKYCNPQENQFRQHPLDYIDVLESIIKDILSKCDPSISEQIIGLGLDATGSTICIMDENNTPLSMLSEFSENPNAMFVLWKDHTANAEAKEINKLAHDQSQTPIDFTKYVGGTYSTEWYWSKALHLIRTDPSVRSKAFSVIELCEWLPSLVTGVKKSKDVVRSRCACGHKAMWHPSWGLPSAEFLAKLDPLLAKFRIFEKTETTDHPVGTLSPEWAARLGLSQSCVVAGGAVDGHVGAIGAGISEKTIVRTMGTSTTDIVVCPGTTSNTKLIQGICGEVDGSVIPGMITYEAGQSSFGDIFAWFKNLLEFPLSLLLSISKGRENSQNASGSSQNFTENFAEKNFEKNQSLDELVEETLHQILPALSKEAEKIPIGEGLVLATDWLNGRRTPNANQLCKATITGLSLGTDAPRIYRALVESAAYGSKRIVESFREQGVEIENVIGTGGIAQKSPFVMQTLADVLNMTVKITKIDQACAHGAAMIAATAAGVYPKIEDAIKAMSSGFLTEYVPNPANTEQYERIYQNYIKLGDFTESQFFSSLSMQQS